MPVMTWTAEITFGAANMPEDVQPLAEALLKVPGVFDISFNRADRQIVVRVAPAGVGPAERDRAGHGLGSQVPVVQQVAVAVDDGGPAAAQSARRVVVDRSAVDEEPRDRARAVERRRAR